jgi:hypothetical protein
MKQLKPIASRLDNLGIQDVIYQDGDDLYLIWTYHMKSYKYCSQVVWGKASENSDIWEIEGTCHTVYEVIGGETPDESFIAAADYLREGIIANREHVCTDCGEVMHYCTLCQQYTQTCCVHYGTCACN